MADPTQYTVKKGQTLNTIAQELGFKDYKDAGISGFDNPDLIREGQVLTIGGRAPAAAPEAPGIKTQEIPGVGTVTVTPKNIAAPAPTAGSGDLSGVYERLGITPPPAATTPGTPSIPGLPSYPSGVSIQGGILKQYDELTKSIGDIEKRIAGANVASDEEKQLAASLAAKKSELDSFDRGVLERVEGLYGQGRGMTQTNLSIQEAKERRTSALERLGLAQEVDTLTTQLGLAKDERKQQGDLATTQYNLAAKRLDIALGVLDKIDRLNEDDKNDARQYLLDVVSFADGKTYDLLDKATQDAILAAVANSPITLDMVKTALKSGAEKAAASARGELRSVEGVGIVQIDPKTLKYKVVVPANPTPAPSSNAPTFEEYLAAQNLPLPTLVPETIAKVRAEYDAKYGNTVVNLGKLTNDQRSELSQAGLSGAPAAVQSYFLNSPAEFQDTFQRDYATGKVKGVATLDAMIKAYTTWFDANKNKGKKDWSALLKPAQ